ncbi:dachshund homolog 1 [Thrips palmi]|uniref:Dachshund homolog 1 n=1 Tax=Thrips palmi TaxID=161013 RepID=A0A6P8Y9X9_THRPL|nr:dachshund homolog 1 [Thrips palmi]
MSSVSRSGSPTPSMDSDVRVPMEHAEDALGLPLPLPLPLTLPGLQGGLQGAPGGWHIPRPSLSGGSGSGVSASGSSGCSGSGGGSGKGCKGCHGRHSTSSQGSSHGSSSASTTSSSNNSTQSGSSGALLLTAANLAALRLESMHPNDKLGKPLDTMSVASSTHFTVVNGITRRTEKPLPKCCCRSHRLTALVLSMSCIISLGIFGAVFYMEMRARSLQVM